MEPEFKGTLEESQKQVIALKAKVERLEAQVRNKTNANQRWSDKVERLEKALQEIADSDPFDAADWHPDHAKAALEGEQE